MLTNPYSDLPPSAFWKTGVAQENPYSINGLYKKKFDIKDDTLIATAGSCFAQHISRYLVNNGFKLLNLEPPPPGLDNHLHARYGYSIFSARYGNIYTIRHLLQLSKEAFGLWEPVNWIWERNGRFFDALRPGIEPNGHASREEVIEHRIYHLGKVRELLQEFHLLIFTLGLTEAWMDRKSGTVFPTAPGTVAGSFDESEFKFTNFMAQEIVNDFMEFEQVLCQAGGKREYNIMLTVSPIPLTASASGQHVLVSSCYSKAVLRTVAGELASNFDHIDYFPAYELITNPRLHSSAFKPNLRSIYDESVGNAMKHFFAAHPILKKPLASQDPPVYAEDVVCEEMISELFGP